MYLLHRWKDNLLPSALGDIFCPSALLALLTVWMRNGSILAPGQLLHSCAWHRTITALNTAQGRRSRAEQRLRLVDCRTLFRLPLSQIDTLLLVPALPQLSTARELSSRNYECFQKGLLTRYKTDSSEYWKHLSWEHPVMLQQWLFEHIGIKPVLQRMFKQRISKVTATTTSCVYITFINIFILHNIRCFLC